MSYTRSGQLPSEQNFPTRTDFRPRSERRARDARCSRYTARKFPLYHGPEPTYEPARPLPECSEHHRKLPCQRCPIEIGTVHGGHAHGAPVFVLRSPLTTRKALPYSLAVPAQAVAARLLRRRKV